MSLFERIVEACSERAKLYREARAFAEATQVWEGESAGGMDEGKAMSFTVRSPTKAEVTEFRKFARSVVDKETSKSGGPGGRPDKPSVKLYKPFGGSLGVHRFTPFTPEEGVRIVRGLKSRGFVYKHDPHFYDEYLRKPYHTASFSGNVKLVSGKTESDAGQRALERRAAQGDKRAQAKLDRSKLRTQTGPKFTRKHIRKFAKPGEETLDVDTLRRELHRIPKPIRNAIIKALESGEDTRIRGRYPLPEGPERKALAAFVAKHFSHEEKTHGEFNSWRQPWGGIEDAPDDHWNSTVVKVKRVGKILGPARGAVKKRPWMFVPSRFFYEHLEQLMPLLTEAVGGTPFLGVFLTAQSQAKLAKAIPPAFPLKSGNHLTIKFVPSEEDLAKFKSKIGKKVTLSATHLIQTADYQAVRLSDTVKVERGYPHITIAWREGSQPAKGNRAMKENKGVAIQPWLKLQGVYDTFPRSLDESDGLGRTMEALGLVEMSLKASKSYAAMLDTLLKPIDAKWKQQTIADYEEQAHKEHDRFLAVLAKPKKELTNDERKFAQFGLSYTKGHYHVSKHDTLDASEFSVDLGRAKAAAITSYTESRATYIARVAKKLGDADEGLGKVTSSSGKLSFVQGKVQGTLDLVFEGGDKVEVYTQIKRNYRYTPRFVAYYQYPTSFKLNGKKISHANLKNRKKLGESSLYTRIVE